ncbi:GntR family transcriptional regulator [Roseomonas sp. GC11]|uniref:GntR family transcriptional regulator n=1 Tax=Roseomonas sp. GC11 TaxID=2950546 RepID=UPI00210E8BF6|nr:GntR family transcriptional regulator [Roseomonas sp. GC11]MCQ4158615.1 GntR family transcriptional regulator [Roseomonas sp. GC11]
MSISRPAPATHASSIFERLRGDILDGRLPPGGRLQIKALMESYGIGQTPLREALNRLSAEGLVLSEDQRGFAVPGISAGELTELTRTRCWLEERGLRESMAVVTEEWEEALLLAGHRLARTPRVPEGELGAAWEVRHREFHRLLISRCGSRWLIGFCEQMTDRHQRYRRLAARRAFPERDVGGEHAAILEAVLARDVEKAVALLTAHYQRTAAVILEDETLFGTARQG